MLGSLSIREVFRIVVSGDDVGRGKPAPDIYLLAARRLGVDPAGCTAVEDSPAGVTAAARAGMRTIAIPNAHSPSAGLAHADHVVESLLEAAELLLSPEGRCSPEASSR